MVNKLNKYEVLSKYLLSYKRIMEITKKSHRRRIIPFLRYWPENHIANVCSQDIESYVVFLLDEGYQRSTVGTVLSILGTFFKWCKKYGFIKANPVLLVERPVVKHSDIRVLDEEEAMLLKEEAAAKDYQTDVIVYVLSVTGIRTSELCNLKVAQIDLLDHVIWIERGKGLKDRFVPFTYQCGERIERYLDSREDDSPYLIPGKRINGNISPWTIQIKISETAENASLGEVTPKTLRYTFASRLYGNDATLEEINQLLGHKKMQNTIDYIELFKEIQKREYDKHF